MRNRILSPGFTPDRNRSATSAATMAWNAALLTAPVAVRNAG